MYIIFIFRYIIMVRYTGRMKVRTGAVNTNQLGLKMSGCPSRVGRNPVNARYIAQRVACNRGICGIPVVHEVIPWRVDMTNSNHFGRNFCQPRSTTCLAAAGGIGNINTPYYRTPAPGEGGCATGLGNPIALTLYTLEYENLANDTEVDSVGLPMGTKVIVITNEGAQIPATAATGVMVSQDPVTGVKSAAQTVIVKTETTVKKGIDTFSTGVKRVVAAVESVGTGAQHLAGTLSHDLKEVEAGATKVVNKTAKFVKILTSDVHSGISKEVGKLGSVTKAATAAVLRKFEGVAASITSAALPGLSEAAADLAHFKDQIHKVTSGAQETIQVVEKSPAKLKAAYNKTKATADAAFKNMFKKAEGGLLLLDKGKSNLEKGKHFIASAHADLDAVEHTVKAEAAKAKKKFASFWKKL